MAAITIVSDGDPYPALAGNPLTNTAVRLFPGSSYSIVDQSYNFTFNYRGGTNTINSQVVPAGSIGIALNGVILTSPIYSEVSLPGSTGILPAGFQWDSVANRASFSADACGGFPQSNGRYTYQSGLFLNNGWMGNSTLYGSNTYFNGTSFGVDKFRHANGHSKILGFMFDGYPIYGPYGYVNPANASSGFTQMTSSYRKKTAIQPGRGYTYAQYVAGSFIQDYEYITNLGTLDQYNGRFTLTPDYPSGTYAYFLTFDGGNLNAPAYPYIAGPSTKEQRPVGGT
jgi:hypothetical protein